MEREIASVSNAWQDGPEEENSFRRAVIFFKQFGSSDKRTHPPGLSRVNNPNWYPSIPAYTRRSFDKLHVTVGRTQGISYNASEPRRNEGKSKSREYIADLCDVLRAFGEEWIRRLALGTSAPQTLPEHYFCSLLGLGIRALRNHFRGATPGSFQDIFALMHVAMAFSYIARKDDQNYSWDPFLEELYQWQNFLSNVIEKGAFVKAMNRLCHPQESATELSSKEVTIDENLQPAEQAMLVRLIDRLSGNSADVIIEENGDHDRQRSTAENEQSSFPRKLQSDTIIKECTGFLDGKSSSYVIL